MEMIARGLATVYEAKSGAEFGGLEEKYNIAEERARRKQRGMWAAKKVESPRDYKIRMADFTESKASKESKQKTVSGFWRRLIWWR
jgi:endonuclease YncB( thermonuclease family)